MPFPKGARRGGEVANELRGEPLDRFLGKDLLLKTIYSEESSSYGTITTMDCELEDGTKVVVSTFSEVVARQAHRIEAQLPLIITPQRTKNYYTIY